MCTVLPPPGGYPTAVNKYISYISHHINIQYGFNNIDSISMYRVTEKIEPFFIFFFRCPVCGEWCKLHWLNFWKRYNLFRTPVLYFMHLNSHFRSGFRKFRRNLKGALDTKTFNKSAQKWIKLPGICLRLGYDDSFHILSPFHHLLWSYHLKLHSLMYP